MIRLDTLSRRGLLSRVITGKRRMAGVVHFSSKGTLRDEDKDPAKGAINGEKSTEINIIQRVEQIRKSRLEATLKRKTVGLVPTMGALHQGHLQLVRDAASECDEVWVSIYVNPTQFGVNEDLSSYPRTFEKDYSLLQAFNKETFSSVGKPSSKVTTIFNPSTEDMYPVGLEHGSYIIMNPSLTQILEGKTRPQFFQGVSTVVTKLLNIIQPTCVYFGQKDIQQLVVMRRMIEEFHIPTTLRCAPTIRFDDGLAMSSRNAYLGKRRRRVALVLSKVLMGIVNRFRNGLRAREDLLGVAFQEAEHLRQEQLRLAPSQRALFEIDYISLADTKHLQEVNLIDDNIGAIASGAIFMQPLEEPQAGEELGLGGDKGVVRLIDNVILGQSAEQYFRPRLIHNT